MRQALPLLIFMLAQMAFSAESRAQTPAPECPALTIYCSTELAGIGIPLKASVEVAGGGGLNLKYRWEVSGGTITAGQGATEITVDTTGNGGENMTATVEVDGLPAGCARVGSCTVGIIDDPPISVLFDCYENLGRAREDERLAQFALALRQQPGAQGYVFYFGPRGVDKRLDRAQKVLVSKLDVHPHRLTGVNAGRHKKFAAQLWIRPAGAREPESSTLFYCPSASSLPPCQRAGMCASLRLQSGNY